MAQQRSSTKTVSRLSKPQTIQPTTIMMERMIVKKIRRRQNPMKPRAKTMKVMPNMTPAAMVTYKPDMSTYSSI